jgi:hypothetical protein
MAQRLSLDGSGAPTGDQFINIVMRCNDYFFPA